MLACRGIAACCMRVVGMPKEEAARHRGCPRQWRAGRKGWRRLGGSGRPRSRHEVCCGCRGVVMRALRGVHRGMHGRVRVPFSLERAVRQEGPPLAIHGDRAHDRTQGSGAADGGCGTQGTETRSLVLSARRTERTERCAAHARDPRRRNHMSPSYVILAPGVSWQGTNDLA